MPNVRTVFFRRSFADTYFMNIFRYNTSVIVRYISLIMIYRYIIILRISIKYGIIKSSEILHFLSEQQFLKLPHSSKSGKSKDPIT